MESYDPKKIEQKWQKKWKESHLYATTEDTSKPKSYVLDMFPYPSGDGLHVGHPKGYIATDVYSRFKRMQGHSVLHPMGWDAFGLPAENYAIKNKVHPRKAVEKNIARFKEQLSLIGFNYDWSRELNTTDPAFYKWTQWIFLQMFKKGLAYESNEPINWCPSCMTGLANEDLENGLCERCGSVVEKKPLRQWVLKITDYADRMLEDLSELGGWPEHIKESQRNWIGRSEGLVFTSPVKDTDMSIETFSAHFEAFYADTFVVIAPDHPLLPKLVEGLPNKGEVLRAAKEMLDARTAQGRSEIKEVEGVFTGRYTVDPVGNGELPIWVANYALADYGTGIVKCSAHDERDFAFAKKYGIPLKAVLFPADPDERRRVEDFEICYFDMQNGTLAEPTLFSGKRAGDIREEIARFAVEKGFARKTVTYRLRDWVFTRQRYWGEPIPLIHCEKDGWVPVPDDQLPVVLPEVEFYEPTGNGESPLANIPEWVNTTCPICGGPAKRETNTMPQWAGSSWYYLRFMDPKNDAAAVSTEHERYWAPVDMYVGGAEHATRHLIYARFWHKFLFDIGVVSTKEPFAKLHSVGLILAEDGRKMSKRFGNVINPDDVVGQFGADAFRVYEMFMGPFENAIAWSTSSITGARRFIERVWTLAQKAGPEENVALDMILHQTIKKVGDDIEHFKFNTAISQMMILLNAADDAKTVGIEQMKTIVRLLAPFAPHVAEELWETLHGAYSVHDAPWPLFDPAKLQSGTIKLAVQINGKLRGTIEVPAGASEHDSMEVARAAMGERLEGKEAIRTVFVPGRLVNFVIADS